MPRFSERSERILQTCHPSIQLVARGVVEVFDCSVLSGYRGKEEQDTLFHSRKSRLIYPQSKHNTKPSEGIDLAPYPIDWNDRERMTLFAGYVLGYAYREGIKLRWGGDWDQDWQVKDNVFDDLVHFELQY